MPHCHLYRFLDSKEHVRIGLLQPREKLLDLSAAGIRHISTLLEADNPSLEISKLLDSALPETPLAKVRLLSPIERQEVWAAGVTYLRSKTARMEESSFSATAYDRVYDAPRPELFFKALPDKVVPPGGEVGIREDARWNVPEPELALVINSSQKLAGFTIGNDMSSRDIEGENLLYLPQAKIYDGSCAVGPAIVIGASEQDARAWDIHLAITRQKQTVFTGQTKVSQIKRSFSELIEFLCRSQQFPHGAILLTGTGIVPPDTFSLAPDDQVEITISGIGTLRNTVAAV